MKTTLEILNKVVGEELYDEDDVRACTMYKVPASKIVECMKEYAECVIQEISKKLQELRVGYSENNADIYLVCMFETDMSKELDNIKNQII